MTPVTPTPPASTSPPPTLGLPDFIQTRLAVPGNPIEVLAHGLAADKLLAHGVREYRAYEATTPRVWLLVFRFDDQPALLAHQKDLEALLGGGGADSPPYYVKSTHTGAWLLVTGFPSHKPVSPEMEAARTAFLSRFAGEE